MNLYLVRHGQAKSETLDPERPLTDVGVQTATRVARFLGKGEHVSVAEIRHSTKLRARQTAEIFSAEAGLRAPLLEMSGLEPMADVVANAAELSHVSHDLMIVGHLPHLSRLASLLVTGNADFDAFSFRECSVLHLRREEDGAREVWRVVWLLYPGLIGRL
ncbi:MAG: hypothetical protein AMS21_03040 [Gemmatimonas sp. SG8_38_2]|nr:MAG: hypothetical protein AMS21_03040 [Gemmatimonas sp. SG8_38_2]